MDKQTDGWTLTFLLHIVKQFVQKLFPLWLWGEVVQLCNRKGGKGNSILSAKQWLSKGMPSNSTPYQIIFMRMGYKGLYYRMHAYITVL